MNKAAIRTALFYTLLTGVLFLFDQLLDQLFSGAATPYWPHIIFAVVIMSISYFLVNRSMESRRRTEEKLRQARDELEARVRERTAELESANRQLSISEERYRTAFDVFSEPTTLYDRNGVLTMQNLVSARNLGGRREDFLGKSITDLFGEAGASYLERIRRVIDTGITEYQEDGVDLPTGKSYYWTCMQRVRNPDGQFATQIMSYDITARIRMEQELRASEGKFATVFQYSPDAIAIIRVADSTIVDINEAFTQLLGYIRTDVVGRNWLEYNLISIDERDKLAALLQEKSTIADYELILATKAGGFATMLVSLSFITINQEPCVLMIAHDITKRKRAEEALRLAQEDLAQGIQEKITLEERQRLARELHDSVSQALYGISLGAHTALSLFDTDRTKTLEALNYVISLVEAGLTEMRALIFELRPESLAMEGLVNAIIKQTAALRARHGVEVELKLCEEPDVPFPVKEAMYRVAQEALQNAVKHARPSRLNVRLVYEPDGLWLEVNDDGKGFDPQAAYPGHLGLRSMRERIIKLGGTLDISSQPNIGTQVRACVPVPTGQNAQSS